MTLDFIDCFLDQVDKVKGHAALNSIPAAHQHKPDKRSTYLLCPQEQKDRESHFQEETLVMKTHNLFGSTEATSTNLRYGLPILLKYPEVAGLGAGESGMKAPGFGDGWGLGHTQFTLCQLQPKCRPIWMPR